ncbi:MAG: hypothetical protein ACF8PN_04145 [Phycisphaerales bacterium]
MVKRMSWVTPATMAIGLAGVVAAEPGDLLVSAFVSDNLVAFNEWTGDAIGPYTGAGADLDGTLGVTLGPDGLVYVASEDANMVLRFDPETRAFVDRFVWDDPDTPEDETGGLAGPSSVLFATDGSLLVGSFDSDAVLRYDGSTGAFVEVFVASGSGGLNGPDAGKAFGPDGRLYIPSYWSNAILRYDGATGAFVDAFVPPNGSGLRRPRQVLFRNGLMYVSCEFTNRVMRFDATTGAYVDDFVDPALSGLRAPTGIGFGPDGGFYVGSAGTDEVLQFDGVTGAYLGIFLDGAAAGLDTITFIYFLPTDGLRVSPALPGVAGVANRVIAANAAPGERVAIAYGFAQGRTPIPGCGGVAVDLENARLLAGGLADDDGRFETSGAVPIAAQGRVVRLQAAALDRCVTSAVSLTEFE